MSAPPTLAITCFASASSKTPRAYVEAAAQLGECLSRAGLVCVNGGGATGCMGALNDAVKANNGRAHGVIHQQWIGEEEAHGLEKMTIVGGNDLQERKRLLLESGDCLIALPGGVGTLDELFEAVAGVAVRLSTLPIVLINTGGYYDGTILQLRRAEEEGLLRCPASQLLHVVKTPAEAVDWCIGAVPCAHTLRVGALSPELAAAAAAALEALPGGIRCRADAAAGLVSFEGRATRAELIGCLEAAGMAQPAVWLAAAPLQPRTPAASLLPRASPYVRGVAQGVAIGLLGAALALRLGAARTLLPLLAGAHRSG